MVLPFNVVLFIYMRVLTFESVDEIPRMKGKKTPAMR